MRFKVEIFQPQRRSIRGFHQGGDGIVGRKLSCKVSP